MTSRNNSCDAGFQTKLIALNAELKKAHAIINQQQHLLQVQKQLMDRKQSIDKVKQKLVTNLTLELQSLRTQFNDLQKTSTQQKQEIEKLTLLNKNLTAANNQLLTEINQGGTSTEEKEIRIQQIKRLSLIQSKPPPPPPLPLPSQIKTEQHQQRKKPTRPLKQLHWEAILPVKIDKSFWAQLDDLKIELDYNQIDELFYQQANVQVTNVTQVIQLQQVTQNILNIERSKSVELVIAKYRLTSSKVISALTNIDLSFLDSEKIEALMKCLPQGKEIEALEKAKATDKMNVPERFLFELFQFPFFEERLCSINFKTGFEDIQKGIDKKLSQLKSIIDLLLHNSQLEKFLLCALAVGNYLNINTPKGVIKGFKLESIEKYNLIKANDRETSLIMYVIEVAEKEDVTVFIREDQEEQLINNNIINQLSEVTKFSLISVFNTEINQIKVGLRHLEKIFQIKDPIIQQTYSTFQNEVQEYFARIENEYLETQKQYEKLCDHFGENYQNYESEKVFSKFYQMFLIIKRGKIQQLSMKQSQINEDRVKETKTQLTRVRQSILESSQQSQVEQARKLPLMELLKLKSKLRKK